MSVFQTVCARCGSLYSCRPCQRVHTQSSPYQSWSQVTGAVPVVKLPPRNYLGLCHIDHFRNGQVSERLLTTICPDLSSCYIILTFADCQVYVWWECGPIRYPKSLYTDLSIRLNVVPILNFATDIMPYATSRSCHWVVLHQILRLMIWFCYSHSWVYECLWMEYCGDFSTLKCPFYDLDQFIYTSGVNGRYEKTVCNGVIYPAFVQIPDGHTLPWRSYFQFSQFCLG